MRFTKLTTVIAASMFIMAVGIILNIAQLYWMAGVLLSLPGVGWAFSVIQSRGVVVRRRAPATGRVGEWVTVEMEARNTSLLPKLHLWVVDTVPPAATLEANSQLPLHLPPHGTDHGSYSLRLERRGCHQLGPARVLSVDPLGLSAVANEAPGTSEILVYPRVVPLRPQCLRLAGDAGMAQSDQSWNHGEGASFHGIREYRPGDPLRRVHWRSSARLGHLTVVEFEDERACEVVIALETQRGSAAGDDIDNSFECGATLAASIATLASEQGHLVRLVAPGWTTWTIYPARGVDALPAIMETLARAEPDSESSLNHELPAILGHVRAGGVLIWITPLSGESIVAVARALESARISVTVLGLDAGSWEAEPRGGKRNEEGWAATAENLSQMRAGFALFRKGDSVSQVMESICGGNPRS